MEKLTLALFFLIGLVWIIKCDIAYKSPHDAEQDKRDK